MRIRAFTLVLLFLLSIEVRSHTDSLSVAVTGEMADTLSPSYVSDIRNTIEKNTQTGLMRLDASRFRQSFAYMGSPDVIKILQMLPGVASGTELLSGLYVYGGTGADNLFLLDGVPLYQVTHLAGLFSSFNTEIIDNLDFYKSGFPARYGGRLSSVVDVTTRKGDMHEFKGMFSLGAVDGKFQFEGPIVKGKTSFNVALRRTWLDLVTTPIFWVANARQDNDVNVISGYSFWDGNIGLDHKIDERNSLAFRFYAGRDWMDMEADDKRETYSMDMNVNWGNILTSLHWNSLLTDTMTSKVIVYHSNNTSTISALINQDAEEHDSAESFGVDVGNLSRINDIGFKADFHWRPSSRNSVRFGTSFIYHFYSPERYDRITAGDGGDSGFSLGMNDKVDFSGYEPSLYFEDEIIFNDIFNLNVGFRYALFGVPGKVYHAFEPRFSARLDFADWGNIRASYTDMNQFNHQISTNYMDLPTNSWMPVTAKHPPMHSRQIVLGLYTDFSNGLTFNAEGFYKIMNNLLEYTGSNTLYPPLTKWETSFSSGRGRAYGVATELSWKTKRTELSAYYTLSWSERYFSDIYPQWYPDRNDSRHKVTLMASHALTRNIDMYAAWNWHNGSRFTAYSHVAVEENDNPFVGPPVSYTYYYSSPNNATLPAYHRLDIGMNFRKKTRRGNESIWNISVYNVYCRMNPFMMISSGFDESGNFRGTAVGLIPVVPSFSYMCRF